MLHQQDNHKNCDYVTYRAGLGPAKNKQESFAHKHRTPMGKFKI
jgi:hypothetical protein